MACVGSSRKICARLLEKLCQWGRTVQVHQAGKVHRVNYSAFRFSSSATSGIFNNAYHDFKKAQLSSCTQLRDGLFHPCERTPDAITIRNLAAMRTQQPGSLPEMEIDPYILLEPDLKDFYTYIRQILCRNTYQKELQEIATYYFDGQGKAIRPMVILLASRAFNYHMYKEKSGLLTSQRDVAMIAEMIHTASLVHDDVIDQSDFRRGKPSVNVVWNHKKVTPYG